jgi:DNA polymerase-3 subunit delta
MIVTITGPNDMLRRAELDAVTAAFIAEHGDMAVERLDGEDAAADRMLESINSVPFLSTRKLVILREPGKQKSFAEKAPDVLGGIPESTDLIIYEPKLDKRLAYYKALKKQTDFRDFAELDARGLANWAASYCTERGGKIGATEARILLDRVGGSQQLLKSELDKLLSYNPVISQATIELLTEPLPQGTVFDLLDAAFAGKAQRVLDLYHAQRALRVEPQAILAMLAWQVHILAVVKAGSGQSADAIAKTAKINPFVVRKTQSIARGLSMQQVKQLVSDVLRLDMQLKRTAIDADEAMQLLLIRLATNKT